MNMFKRNEPYLLIDCMGILHAIRYAQMKMGGQSTETYGIIGGFLNAINSISYRFSSGNLVFCWDSPYSYRRDKYPFYKNRKPSKALTAEEAALEIHQFKQFDILRTEVIPAIGFEHNHIEQGYEADDLIAKAIIENEDKPKIIVSSDEDLYQMLDRAPMYIYRKKALLSAQGFTELYGIKPQDWWRVKAIAGCKSDTIPGVPGIGETLALKYLKGELTGKRKTAIEQNGNLIERNEWLVRLPLSTDKECPMINLNYEESPRSAAGFLDMITKYTVFGFGGDRYTNVAARWNLR